MRVFRILALTHVGRSTQKVPPRIGQSAPGWGFLRSQRPGFGPRAQTASDPAGLSFAPIGLDLLLLFFRILFGRGCIGSRESSVPPPFAPFLKVEWDLGHIKAPGVRAAWNEPRRGNLAHHQLLL